MYTYRVIEWLVFFYIYCVLGWCWESCYVSIEHKKWTNRGFMHGPYLPIYGSGAIAILFATLPVKSNLLLIFILGMLTATVLEYITGAAMLAIFKIRYWDYSSQPFNLNGHICLGCSILWGAFSMLLTRVIHKPIERLVLSVPYEVLTVIALIFTVVFVYDLAASVRAAFDLKEMLQNFTKNNEELARLEKRLDVVIAFLEDDKQQLKERVEARSGEKAEKRRQRMQYAKELLDNFKAKAADRDSGYEKFRSELEDIHERYLELKDNFRMRSSMKHIIKGNPSMNSVKFKEALDEIKERISGK